jgi:hypothetical protein
VQLSQPNVIVTDDKATDDEQELRQEQDESFVPVNKKGKFGIVLSILLCANKFSSPNII